MNDTALYNAESFALKLEDLKLSIDDRAILHGISLSLQGSGSLGIVGSSGSGKTMSVRALIGLLPQGSSVSGSYELDGANIDLSASEKAWAGIRGRKIGLVMQDPFSALDPLMKCGKQILIGAPRSERDDFDIEAAFAEVGLTADVAEKRPHELSGGMRQRVVIAAALATKPELLIADEATSALDVITSEGILDLLDKIRLGRSMPLIIISHDLSIVESRTDNLIVIEAGRVVESGLTKEVIGAPKSEYTKALLEASYLEGRTVVGSGRMPAPAPMPEDVILEVDGISKHFGEVTALSDVSISIAKGECVAVVGESGCGKTTLARCIVGLTKADGGSIKYTGKAHPQIVFQDPYASLNPAHRIDKALREALRASGHDAEDAQVLLRLVGLGDEILTRKPAGLSGGQRQRVAIARALAAGSDLLVMDEAVSSLDVLVQKKILEMLAKLMERTGLSVLFITHNLAVAHMTSDRIYVMKDAEVVESGDTEKIFGAPEDDYTKKLLASLTTHGGGSLVLNNNSTQGDGHGDGSLEPDKRTQGDGTQGHEAQGDDGAVLYQNAKIYTAAGDDWDKHPAEAMITGKGGKILYVGSLPDAEEYLSARASTAARVDMGGRSILPGFCDTHVHMPGSAITELYEMYLYKPRRMDDLLTIIRDYIEAHPDMDAYFGSGFYTSVAGGPDGFSKELLDAIEDKKPIVLESSDGHSLWLNTAAFAACGIDADTALPEGGRLPIDESSGEPIGIITDAHNLVTLKPSYSKDEMIEALRYYQDKMLSWGYTAALHIAPHFVDPETMLALLEDGTWKLRTNMSALAESDRPVSEALDEAAGLRAMYERFGELVKISTVKFFEDGVVEGKTAYLKEAYADEESLAAGYRSEPIWDTHELAEAVAAVTDAGYQVHIHSIGDGATEEALRAIEMARSTGHTGPGVHGFGASRDTLTHLHVVSKEAVAKMAELGIIAAHQPFWHFKEPNWYDEIDLGLLGPERAEAAYPVASMIEAGVKVAFSGDYPASPINNPFWAIRIAVTRNIAGEDDYGVPKIEYADDPTWLRNPAERISLKAAIEAYTINGAYLMYREDEIGSLEPGKSADFIVLSEDPFAIRDIELDGIEVLETYIRGERVA